MSDATMDRPPDAAKALAGHGRRHGDAAAPRPSHRRTATGRMASATRADPPVPATIGDLLEFDLGILVDWMRAGMRWIMAAALVGALAATAFALLTKPRFTTYTDIVVDPANLQVVSEDLYRSSAQSDSQLAAVESKMQLLVSGNVLMRAIKELALQYDKEFVPENMFAWMSEFTGVREGPPEDTALRSLIKRVSVQRIDKSFVVSLSVWTENPAKSVRVANAIVEAFKIELAAADAAGASQAAASLQARLDEMREEVNAADARVAAFRRTHDLQSSAGELVNEQSLTQLNAKRNDAQVRLSEAESRFAEVQQAAAAGGVTTDGLLSPTISGLRQQYATLKQQVASAEITQGPRHPNLVALRSQLDSLASEINAEISRLLEGARSELEQARSVLAALDAEATAMRVSVSADDDARVALRELEREASAKAAVYEAFLSRTTEIAEREWINATNVRVISSPVAPESRSYPPRTTIMFVVGAIGGALIGAGIAIVIGWRRSARAVVET